jgi:hypothetical protein
MRSQLWKFGGSVLLAFAIAALPVVSHADSISSGPFVSGTISAIPESGHTVTLTITGTLGTFTIVTGALSEAIPGLFVFTGGTLTVTNSQGMFVDTLTTGNLQASGTGSFTIGAALLPTATLESGSTSFNFGIVDGALTRGTAGVNFEGQLSPIPEPGTLGMLGSGLIGLAGMARRRLKR